MDSIEEMVEIPALGKPGTVKVRRVDHDLLTVVDFFVSSINPQLSTGRNVDDQLARLRTKFAAAGFDFKVDGTAQRVRTYFSGIIGDKKQYHADWTDIGQNDGVVREIYNNYLAHKAQFEETATN